MDNGAHPLGRGLLQVDNWVAQPLSLEVSADCCSFRVRRSHRGQRLTSLHGLGRHACGGATSARSPALARRGTGPEPGGAPSARSAAQDWAPERAPLLLPLLRQAASLRRADLTGGLVRGPWSSPCPWCCSLSRLSPGGLPHLHGLLVRDHLLIRSQVGALIDDPGDPGRPAGGAGVRPLGARRCRWSEDWRTGE